MLEGLLLALPLLSAPHFNMAPFSPQCRSPRLLMPHWRNRPALRSCVTPVGMCARERCCVCRTSTSTSGALCAKVGMYLALCLATECPEPGFPDTLLTRSPSRKLSGHTTSFCRVLSHLVRQRNPQEYEGRETLDLQAQRHEASPESENPILESLGHYPEYQ